MGDHSYATHESSQPVTEIRIQINNNMVNGNRMSKSH